MACDCCDEQPVESHWLVDTLERIFREALFDLGIWKRATLVDVNAALDEAYGPYLQKLAEQPHPLLRALRK